MPYFYAIIILICAFSAGVGHLVFEGNPKHLWLALFAFGLIPSSLLWYFFFLKFHAQQAKIVSRCPRLSRKKKNNTHTSANRRLLASLLLGVVSVAGLSLPAVMINNAQVMSSTVVSGTIGDKWISTTLLNVHNIKIEAQDGTIRTLKVSEKEYAQASVGQNAEFEVSIGLLGIPHRGEPNPSSEAFIIIVGLCIVLLIAGIAIRLWMIHLCRRRASRPASAHRKLS